VFIFVNFSFALFTPPLGDYQHPHYSVSHWMDEHKRHTVELTSTL
jgi:hypothetical protein